MRNFKFGDGHFSLQSCEAYFVYTSAVQKENKQLYTLCMFAKICNYHLDTHPDLRVRYRKLTLTICCLALIRTYPLLQSALSNCPLNPQLQTSTIIGTSEYTPIPSYGYYDTHSYGISTNLIAVAIPKSV